MHDLDRSEIDLSQRRSECEHLKPQIDLNECEHFLKANFDRSEIDFKLDRS